MAETPSGRLRCPYDDDKHELKTAAREMTEAAVQLRILADEWRAADAPQRITRLETIQGSHSKQLDWHKRAGITALVTLASLIGWFGDVRGWW